MAINRDKVEATAIKLLQQGKYDKAIVEFKKLVDDDKTDVRNLLKLGETYVKVGARKESIDAYEKAAAIYTEQGFYLKAVAVFKQILRVDANVPELHLKLAELYQQLGLTSDALAHYQTVAVFYEQGGRPRDALDMLKRMVDLDPDNIASRIKLGELFAQQGLAEEASQEMRSALNFLKQQQRFDDYVRVGERLVAYDAGALDVAQDLARIYMQREQPSVALGKLQMCFKADPRNVEVLAMIAQAFLDMQQVPKTISVFKEMAKIYSADGNVELATRTWERVIELHPGDAEAEQALGRNGPQTTAPAYGRPTLVPTVVAPAQAQAPIAAQPNSAPQPRVSAEDEQLQRLLTETDVYVKYGLKEKAIEHIQKVFAVRPDHIPALEKLKDLQQQVGGRDLAATLKRLVDAAEKQGHARVEEWRRELSRAGAPARPLTQPSLIIPVSQSAAPSSGEGDIVITDDSQQSQLADEPFLQSESGVIRLDDNASGIIALDPSALDEPFLDGDGSMMDDMSGTAALPPDEPDGFDAPREIPRMPTGVLRAPEPLRPPPMGAPPPIAASPEPPVLALDDVVDFNDADALVRKALQDISAEDVAAAADELLLEASPDDILPSSGEGDAVEGPQSGAFELSTGQMPALLTDAAPESRTVPTRSGISNPDDDEIDRLAREAVDDANRSLVADVAATALMSLSPQEQHEIDELEGSSGFSSGVSPVGATVVRASAAASLEPPALPPEMRDDDDSAGFDEPTLALLPPAPSSDVPTDERPRKAAAARPAPSLLTNSPSSDDDDDNVPTLSGAKQRPDLKPRSASDLSFPDIGAAAGGAADAGGASAVERERGAPPARATAAPPPELAGDFSEEFDPSSFDLPDDVKELLRRDASGPTPAAPGAEEPLEAIGELEELQPEIPSAASLGLEELPPEMSFDAFSEPSGEITLRGKLGLANKAHGFEDDPANQFFPDELEEAEFFIQQELLDEARDILSAILEDVPDSARVQWMLARVVAKENGEPEPPAPWEQRILEEVQAQLEDLGISEATGQREAAEPALGDGTAQVSVEEVLSQFKKGVAETVPEDDAATHYELGIAYKEMGLHDDAVTEFNIAARASSRAADARFMIGVVRLDQGRREDALQALEEAVAVPTATRDQRGAAEYQRGVVLEELDRLVEALRAFKAAKAHGSAAVDLDRRIQELTAKVGGDDGGGPAAPNGSRGGGGGSGGGNNGSNNHGANGHGKPGERPPGRGPKNIDYV